MNTSTTNSLLSKWNISFLRGNGLYDCMVVEMPRIATEQDAVAAVLAAVPDASKFEVFGTSIIDAR